MTSAQISMVAACVVLETVEHALYRAGSRDKRARVPLIASGVTAHLLGLLVWYLLLRVMQVGVAAPLIGAAGYITVVLAGRLVFRERVGTRRWLGVTLILAGLTLMICYSNSDLLR